MKKKTMTLIAIFAIFLAVGCSKKVSVKGGDLVTFKDTSLNITTNDLYDNLKEKYGTSAMIDLIDKKILNKEYSDSEEIENYANTQIESIKNYYKTDSEFLEYINNYGYKNESDLRDYLKLSYKRNLAVKDYIKSLISDDDIKSYYENNITGDVTGSHILIEVKDTSSMTEDEAREVKEEALNKAKEAIEKLNNGTSFSDVAKEYSTDSATKDNGGNLGTFNTLELDAVTRQAYQNLKVNEYSKEAVETEYGYEIFLKENEKDKPELSSVKTKITEVLTDEKLNADSKLQYKALMAIREKYGFSIKDSDLEVYYENSMNNLLSSE